MSSVFIKHLLLEAIIQHAQTEYPYECCGVLLGSYTKDGSKSVVEIRKLSNAKERSEQSNRYVISSEDLLHVELYARKNHKDIIGFYHSHPDHAAIPSTYDLAHAWPFYSYMIVSVIKGVAQDISISKLNKEGSSFESELIQEGE